MVKNRPFSKTEMKLLVFKKIQRGMSYSQACREVSDEIENIIQNSKVKKGKKDTNKIFKEEFKKLTDGKK
jgi:hypothetical protein